MEQGNEQPVKNEVSKPSSPAPKKKGTMTKRHSGTVQLKEATPENFIAFALQSGRSIDEIQQLINFRNAELARLAKLDFMEAKRVFLKTVPKIIKNQDANFGETSSGKKGASYRYSDLDNLINTVKDAESTAGLSHDFKTTQDNNGWVTITCILSHIGGHSETDTIKAPPDKSGGKNDIQAMKSTVSYLRRATLESVLGLSQGGDDNDGHTNQNTFFADLETLSSDGFLHVMKSVRQGTMTIEQVKKSYALTAEQVDSLERVAPHEPSI
jgi:hypothetical protein